MISADFSQENSSHCLISPVSVASNMKKSQTLPHLYLSLLTSLFVLWFNLLRPEQHTHFLNILCCYTSRPQLKSKGNNWSRNLLQPIKSLVKVSNRLIRTWRSLPFKAFSVSYFRPSLAQQLQAHFHTHLPR